MFLRDWKPMNSPLMGRHLTDKWGEGEGDTHFVDRIQIGQPNLNTRWKRINAAECGDACITPRQFVGFGTTRTSYYMEHFDLQSQLFCLTQLRYGTRTAQQIERVYAGLKKIPEIYTSDFLRVHAVDFSPAVQIASSSLLDAGTNVFVPDVTPDAMNIQGQLTEIHLGSAGLLPTSGLTFPLLDYYATGLALEGYAEAGSGLADGVYNLVTDQRTWARMTNGNPSMKNMMALEDPQKASALYKLGQGVQQPFGNYAPTLDNQPIRFQHVGGGVLNRVYPYYNVPTDTGIKRVTNPAYVNARYQISFIWHPKAIKLFTPDFKKMHEMVPSVNSAMYGKWAFKNGDVLNFTQPDGTACTINNDKNEYFYWLCAMELGFEYLEPQLIVPILHLTDGSGKDSIVDDAICGTAPSYVAQSYSDNPLVC
jgi:hypothetical protein